VRNAGASPAPFFWEELIVVMQSSRNDPGLAFLALLLSSVLISTVTF
jgi:hypothetical protein